MKLTKLTDIDRKSEFWRGTRFRLINNGKNLHRQDKYYDYILALMPWDNEKMILVNVTKNNTKEGAVYANPIIIKKSKNKLIVKLSALKKALGKDFLDFFLIN